MSKKIEFTVDGERLFGEEGATIAAVLLARGQQAWRVTPTSARRGVFCGIGMCFDCTLSVDGVPNRRACLTPIGTGMTVITDLAES